MVPMMILLSGLLLAAGLVPFAGPAQARVFTLADMVGRWYHELKEAGTFDGVPYTIRRQIESNRPDGTKTAQFRFYDNCRLVGELVNELDYFVQNGVYRTRCTAIIKGGQRYACDETSHYDLRSADAEHISYANRSTGILYRHTRVGADFALPLSGCVSRGPAQLLPDTIR